MPPFTTTVRCAIKGRNVSIVMLGLVTMAAIHSAVRLYSHHPAVKGRYSFMMDIRNGLQVTAYIGKPDEVQHFKNSLYIWNI